MSTIRKFICLALLVGTILPLASGCVGVGTTKEDNKRKFDRVVQYDVQSMSDDLALFLQIQRPMRTNRWVID